ncbi:MAG: helix-turn-helix domain-containing protein [Rhizobiaceae bacterium]
MRSHIPSYQLYGEKAPQTAEFWLHCETLPERTHLHNWEIAPHRHDAFFQLFWLSEGRGEIVGGPAPLPFEAPCILFIPPGEVHGFTYSRDVDGLVVTALADRLHSISTGDRQIALFSEMIGIVPVAEGNGDAHFAAQCIHRIHGELAGQAPGRTILLETLMTAAIVSLARAHGGAAVLGTEVDERDRLRMEQLQEMIGAHFREHRPAAFYAGRLGLSAAHLNRICRRMTGASLQQLVARRLVDAARRELLFTPNPVQEIAYGLGYADPAYFNRFFRRQTGTTPGAFRERERRKLGE